MPEKVVRFGVRYSWHSGLWTVLWPIGLKVFCKKERENSGLAGGGVFEVREELFFLRIAFRVMCHRIVWNSVMPEKVV